MAEGRRKYSHKLAAEQLLYVTKSKITQNVSNKKIGKINKIFALNKEKKRMVLIEKTEYYSTCYYKERQCKNLVIFLTNLETYVKI